MTNRSGGRERAVDGDEPAYLAATVNGHDGNEAFGACALCGAVFDRSSISRHVQGCVRRVAGEGDGALRIHAQSIGRVVYWLHLIVRKDAPLDALDATLRASWLDQCCEHLSGLTLGKHHSVKDESRQFVSSGFAHEVEPDPRVVPMKGVLVGDVFALKMEFVHEYDFGTTTQTTLRVVGSCAALPGREPVRVVARNNTPVLACGACERESVALVCSACYGSDDALLCEACAEDHECGEEMLLPWLNSPRTGVCAYTGPPPARNKTNGKLKRTWVKLR